MLLDSSSHRQPRPGAHLRIVLKMSNVPRRVTYINAFAYRCLYKLTECQYAKYGRNNANGKRLAVEGIAGELFSPKWSALLNGGTK